MHFLASFAVNTTFPLAAPGDAAKPFPILQNSLTQLDQMLDEVMYLSFLDLSLKQIPYQ